ncbi:MAG: peptidoglycan editing factor PgeF [Candidatus Pacebacteria bacterium]|nr:peptidoglycan editing factor PgeF [Candidatus Paceibacterota bacterium]MDR3583487.1 peptidoglycan editing factor PgeF [Candidatus Paceibacterota bacterium]
MMLEFFKKYPEILAVMSEKKDGSMKLFDNSDLNAENRKQFFESVGIKNENVVAAEVVHGNGIAIINNTAEKIISGADGLVSQNRNIFLSITVADCVPVYICEEKNEIIAIAHCGWRSIVKNIIPKLLEKIRALGGQAENLKITLGPALGPCHFEIQKDILAEFKNYPESVVRKDGKIFVDMKKIIWRQLEEAGAKPENIKDESVCVFESERYFSFRRDKPEKVEAMVAIIGMKK